MHDEPRPRKQIVVDFASVRFVIAQIEMGLVSHKAGNIEIITIGGGEKLGDTWVSN